MARFAPPIQPLHHVALTVGRSQKFNANADEPGERLRGLDQKPIGVPA